MIAGSSLAQSLPLQLTAPSNRQHKAGQVYRNHSSVLAQKPHLQNSAFDGLCIVDAAKGTQLSRSPPWCHAGERHTNSWSSATNARRLNSLDDAKKHGEGVGQQIRIVKVQY